MSASVSTEMSKFADQGYTYAERTHDALIFLWLAVFVIMCQQYCVCELACDASMPVQMTLQSSCANPTVDANSHQLPMPTMC